MCNCIKLLFYDHKYAVAETRTIGVKRNNCYICVEIVCSLLTMYFCTEFQILNSCWPVTGCQKWIKPVKAIHYYVYIVKTSAWIVIDKCQTLMPSRNCVLNVLFNSTVLLNACIQLQLYHWWLFSNAIVNFMDPTVLLDKMCYFTRFNCTAQRICS